MTANGITEKKNIIGDAASEEKNIESNIYSRGIYLTYMLLSGTDNLRHKKLVTELENN